MDLRNGCFFQSGCCFALVGLMIFVTGTMFRSTTTTMLNKIVSDEMALGGMPTGISTYKRFGEWISQTRSKPGGRQVTMYVFNMTNPEEVLNGAKPKMAELGPFVYQHEWVRENLTWNADGTQLDYHEFKRYYYIPSAEYPDDKAVKITTVRLAFLGMIGSGVRDSYSGTWTTIDMAHMAWSTVVPESKRFYETRSVNELAVGFADTQLTLGHFIMPSKAPPTLPGPLFNGTMDFPIERHDWYNMNLPTNTLYTGLKTDKSKENAYYLTQRFGFKKNLMYCTSNNIPMNPCPCYTAYPVGIHLPNGSTIPILNIPLPNGTSVAACDRVEKVHGVNIGYTNPRRPWGTDDASEISGADGINWPPLVKEDTTLRVWLDACARYVPMKKQGETTIKDIPVWRFGPPADFWQNASVNPSNEKYYMYMGEGILNLSSVQHDAPVFATRPHFLGCDQKYIDSLEGVSPPDPAKHDFDIWVEPVTGLAMGGAGRVQLNVRIGQVGYNTNTLGAIDYHTHFDNVKETLLPLMWIADGGVMTDEQADEWKGMLGAAIGLQGWLPWIFCISGGLVLIVGVLLCLVGGNCIKGGVAAFSSDKVELEGEGKKPTKMLVILSIVLGVLAIAALLGVLGGVAASLAKGMKAGEAESLLQFSYAKMKVLLRE